jgi:hypothetical protein
MLCRIVRKMLGHGGVVNPMMCADLHEVCGIALAMSKLTHNQLHVLRKPMDMLHQVCLQRFLQYMLR